MRNFREYDIWNDAMQLVLDVYAVTKQFPAAEVYGLSNQIQRAVVSIPSNIAEGAGRKSDSDFAHFLNIALGSAFEVETQLRIAYSLNYIDEPSCTKVVERTMTIEKELTNFINAIKR